MTLVSRLRARKLPVMAAAGQYEYVVNERPDELCEEAADELERLQQRVEVLEGALGRAAENFDRLAVPHIVGHDVCDFARKAAEQARAALGEGR